jgi:hypothetical protein
MNSISLGSIEITVQNESAPNEDVYTIPVVSNEEIIDVDILKGVRLNEIGHPERFIIDPNSFGWNVYTKQPDAAVQLALYLNQKEGTSITEEEIETVRNQLIDLQG